jgi:S1-C subfamily serine protease
MLVRTFLRTTLVLASVAGFVSAQTPPPQKPNKPQRVDVRRSVAPQVVTIVHRLNGLKMFRLLRRSTEQAEAIARLDEAFNLTDDVHTNIIAGLALDDGRTIAAWLPDADLEFGPFVFSPNPPAAPAAPNPKSSFPVIKNIEIEKRVLRGGMFGSPDLTVITPDGRRMTAEYVGLDGATGLSILHLTDDNIQLNPIPTGKPVGEGDSLRLISPQPAAAARALVTSKNVFVRMGTTFGTVLSVKLAPAGEVARFRVKSPRVSLTNIGGVAVNDAGATVGIVDAVEEGEARILPTALVQRAAQRVLAHQASVPKPWLGVKGESVAQLGLEQFKNNGWKSDRASFLLERQLGILLTSIAPGSPAAAASLRAGDVILKVNNEDVHSDDDFSWMLDEAGPSSLVTMTLARPDRVTEEAVNVELRGLLNPELAFNFHNAAPAGTLISQGIETIVLKPLVATQLGEAPGLLVVYVDPSSAAFNAGLRPGDVIESIDGKPLKQIANNLFPGMTSGAKSSFEVVRKKQKVVVTIAPPSRN